MKDERKDVYTITEYLRYYKEGERQARRSSTETSIGSLSASVMLIRARTAL